MQVPFFRPSITEAEISEVARCLRSGWLTTGPTTRGFEEDFARAVGARHAVALNSCTAALHLAVESLGLARGQAVLVPTLTFAATAEIIHYPGALPILVDCEPETGNLDLEDAEHKIHLLRKGKLLDLSANTEVVGIIPMHLGGLMMDMDAVAQFAARHGLWVVEDAAHAFPASWRRDGQSPWQRCGEGTSDVACYSFYANKTITTGEGGMAVTQRPELAERMRLMSLHGLSHGAWSRFRKEGSWDYRILDAGYKYNLTDLAAALGVVQLRRAESMRQKRERLALRYREALADMEEIELPPSPPDRLHAWHLFPIRLRLERLTCARHAFVSGLLELGVSVSVHWRPLHLHPYYQERLGWTADLFPAANSEWPRRLTLPLFSDMSYAEQDHVIAVVRSLCVRHRRTDDHALVSNAWAGGEAGSGDER